eukprot:Gb_26476 [translate_table: standard]
MKLCHEGIEGKLSLEKKLIAKYIEVTKDCWAVDPWQRCKQWPKFATHRHLVRLHASFEPLQAIFKAVRQFKACLKRLQRHFFIGGEVVQSPREVTEGSVHGEPNRCCADLKRRSMNRRSTNMHRQHDRWQTKALEEGW